MKKIVLSMFIPLVMVSFHVQAVSGEMNAMGCAGCHGTQGKLAMESFPALAAMPKTQFIRAMQDFQTGKRSATVMKNIAEGFTDADFVAMADYFAAQKLD
jgi:sulfide dehydrogenase cytochrome subunit